MSRRYFIELTGALVLYGVLLVAANFVDDRWQPTGSARMALALTPMIGAAAGAWAIMRAIWRMDELQRRIQLDAIAIAFLTTALGTFGWGFAEGAGAPDLPTFAIWPIMGTAWAVGMVIAHRHYR
jgi:membrane associated rhomboid family serine protease